MATKDSFLIRMFGEELFNPDVIDPSLSLIILRKLGGLLLIICVLINKFLLRNCWNWENLALWNLNLA